MTAMANKLIFLGYSAINLPLLMELAHESLGYNEFVVFKNIESSENPIFNKKLDFYNYLLINVKDSLIPDGSPCFLGVTNVHAKTAVYNYFRRLYSDIDDKFISIIHPQSYCSKSAFIDKAVLVEPHVIISSQTKIGFGVTIKRGANIGHHNILGDYVSVNPGCVLSGNVTIGSKSTLGTGTIIRDSITIGDNCIIGMGSVVTKNIPANSVAYGNPCKVIKNNPQ